GRVGAGGIVFPQLPPPRRGRVGAGGVVFLPASSSRSATVSSAPSRWGAGALASHGRAGGPLRAGYAENEPPRSAMGLPLVPWPNRIRDGRYTFGGRELQLPITEPERGNAIHGLARSMSWTATERSPDSVTLSDLIEPAPGYPFRLACSVTYSLDGGGL